MGQAHVKFKFFTYCFMTSCHRYSRSISFLSWCLTQWHVGESGQPVRVRCQLEQTEASRVNARHSPCRDLPDLQSWYTNKAVTDRRLRPRCCHLGSYFKRPKSSPVRLLACNWHYCAQFIAKPKAASALCFSWVATSSNLSLHTPFNGPLSRTTRVSRYQKGTNLDFTEARDSEWQWH